MNCPRSVKVVIGLLMFGLIAVFLIDKGLVRKSFEKPADLVSNFEQTHFSKTTKTTISKKNRFLEYGTKIYL